MELGLKHALIDKTFPVSSKKQGFFGWPPLGGTML
ncbi:hypothetical protein PAECIP111890_02832 [Paenibacillus sp. JJ-223]|nr:hypothetical protein PAECIP111890_02832 [Paenibacillus sp. JJ-223]